MRIHLSILAWLAFFLSPAASGAWPYGYMQKLQNRVADAEGLPRFKDGDELQSAIDNGELVRVEDTEAYRLDMTLGEKDPEHRFRYAYVQPWTKDFIDQELAALHNEFGTRYVITSLVRTQRYQERLCGRRGRNANAICGRSGWRRSAHLTGATVDIGRIGLSEKEQTSIRKRLKELARLHKVIYIEEGGSQLCFHIMVRPSYRTGVTDRR